MAPTDILQGWNAIAEFLNCDVRTAKRWETDRGLPVRRTRRTPGVGRANVHAVVSELEAWIAAAKSTNDTQPNLTADESKEFRVEHTVEHTEDPTPALTPQLTAPPHRRRWVIAAVVVTVSLAAATLAVWAHSRKADSTASARVARESVNHSVLAMSSAGPNVIELYLHGSYLFEQRTPETLAQAKSDFAQAISTDQSYAPAYAGLAKTYDLLREYSTMPSKEAYPLAKAAALRAIALDPQLPDAHAALGYEEFFWEWNGAEAEREFQRAIALDANCAIAHHWYGAMLMHQARYADAIRELDRAQALEPASAGVLGTRAYAIGLSGRRAEAADMVQDILTRVPDSAPLHFILAQLSLQQPRDIPRYLDELRKFAKLRHSDDEMRLIDAVVPVYRREGEQAMWRAMLHANQQQHGATHPTYLRAQLEVALGMKNAALRDLAELQRDHDPQMIGLDIDAMLAPLRDDPQFGQLVAEVGLPRTSYRG
jgi:tetratricopeptide (TPR) repeat protein